MTEQIQKMAFTVDEAAMHSSLGRDAIYDAIRDGRLQARKWGRRTIIPADALQRFLTELPPLRLRQRTNAAHC